MDKKILIITEGANKEIQLFQLIKDLHILPASVQIVPYCSNIYNLYDLMMQESGGDFDSLDFLSTLSNHERVDDKKKILQDDYTDILLIFDWDPQDHDYSEESVKKMLSFFSESSAPGKLYLSYPMIESFYHLSWLQLCNLSTQSGKNPEFLKCTFCLDELIRHQYKSRVNNEGICHGCPRIDTHSISLEIFQKMLCEHIFKSHILLHSTKDSDQDDLTPLQTVTASNFHSKLFNKQNECWKNKHTAAVVSTSCFYLAESYPSRISHFIK